MNRIILFLILFSFCHSNSIAQQCPQNFMGTKTLYKQQQTVYTKMPNNYQPVFINYVGRHGARHLTKDVATSFAYSLLQKADSANELSEKGKLLKEMVLVLEKIEKNNFKSISYEGVQELQQIATRMYNNFKPVFISKQFKTVEITKEKRTGQSAVVFVNRLKEFSNRKDSVRQIINDTTLRFFDMSPAYLSFEEKGSWQQSVEQLKKSFLYDSIINKAGASFFTASFLITLDKKILVELTADIFGFITILPSLWKEMSDAGYSEQQLNFQSFYTCDELTKLGALDDAEDFLLKAAGTDSMGVQVTIAAPLLMDFIKSTDEYISGKGPAMKLRFAHAETIAPMAALLSIKGASTPVNNIASFTDYWKAEKIVPLSANIQWILYKKKNSNDYLIKILLNEKEVAIDGFSAKSFPCYSWKELRKFYLLKLQHAGLNAGDNYIKYLQNLDQ